MSQNYCQIMHTVGPLYYGHHWDHVKLKRCPYFIGRLCLDQRGVLLEGIKSEVPLYQLQLRGGPVLHDLKQINFDLGGTPLQNFQPKTQQCCTVKYYAAVHVHVIRIKSLLSYDIHAIRYLSSTINGVNKSLMIYYYHRQILTCLKHAKVILNIDVHV